MREKLKKQLVKGEVDKVQEAIIEYCQSKGLDIYENAAYLNWVRHNNIVAFLNNGFYTLEEYNVEYNKSILSLINIIDKLFKKKNPFTKIESVFLNTTGKKFTLNKNEILVKSLMEGVVYFSTSPDSKELIEVGKKVKKGELTYLLGVMKQYTYNFSEYDGIIKRIYAQNGQRVATNGIVYIIEVSDNEISMLPRKDIIHDKLNKRDFISIYSPVYGKDRTITSYILVNPIDGVVILPNINKLISFAKDGIKQGECIYQIERNDKVYDVISPFSCSVELALIFDKKNILTGESVFNVVKK